MKDLIARAAAAISAAFLFGPREYPSGYFDRADEISHYIATGERPA